MKNLQFTGRVIGLMTAALLCSPLTYAQDAPEAPAATVAPVATVDEQSATKPYVQRRQARFKAEDAKQIQKRLEARNKLKDDPVDCRKEKVSGTNFLVLRCTTDEMRTRQREGARDLIRVISRMRR